MSLLPQSLPQRGFLQRPLPEDLAAKTHSLLEPSVPGRRHKKGIANYPILGSRKEATLFLVCVPMAKNSDHREIAIKVHGECPPGNPSARSTNRGQRLHSFYLQESPPGLHTANQNSEVSPSTKWRAKQDELPRLGVERCGKAEEPEPPGRGTAGVRRQLASRVPCLSAPRGAGDREFTGLTNREVGKAAVLSRERCAQTPQLALLPSPARGLGVLPSCL